MKTVFAAVAAIALFSSPSSAVSLEDHDLGDVKYMAEHEL